MRNDESELDGLTANINPIGLIVGAVSFELLITAGFLPLLLPAVMGILFAQVMITVGMVEEAKNSPLLIPYLKSKASITSTQIPSY